MGAPSASAILCSGSRAALAATALGVSLAAILAACASHNNGSGSGAAGPPPAQPPPPAYATTQPPPPGYATAAPPPGYPGTMAPAPAGYPPPAGPAPTYAQTAPAPTPGYAPPAPGAAPPAPSASAAPPGPLAPTDPNSLQAILAGIQGALQGTLIAPGSVPADVTEAGLKVQGARLAPGMQTEGDELKQTLAEGQHAVMWITMQAGKCYTVVGFSAPGAVKELDLNLLAPPFYVTLAGQSMGHDNAPSIGASHSPMCPVLAFPLQYKLDVFAKSGGGPVSVQLYSKAKR